MDYHFRQRILHLQLYAFLILVAEELWDLEKQLMHFADMLAHILTMVSGMKFNRRVQDFFFANSQQSKCTEKIVIFMYDHGWNTQFIEFDIVDEEGDVPLLMSIPQIRNLGFQFELTPDTAYLSCASIGIRKMALKTAISIHLILDLQGCMVLESSAFQDSTSHKSFHNMIILNTVRSLFNKINKRKKLW